MPADYSSTARALALPVSPPQSPSTNQQPVRAAWSRSQSQSALSRPQTRSSYDQDSTSLRGQILDHAERLQRHVYRTVKKLSLLQRFLAGVALIACLVLTILFFVYNERIFAWLEPIAERWKNLKGGWLILWLVTFATAFPPLIGYSTCVTLSGFVYGFPNGWFIVASATICGSLSSFLLSRTLLSGFVQRLVAKDSRFAALALVLKHDGLKLLIMIRLCPLPYSISNGAISTIETVQPPVFALATAIASPKLMIHVFIGSRLAAIARSGAKMDSTTKAVNYTSIVGGIIFGVVTGYLIYQRTAARSRELEAQERNNHKPYRGSRLPPPDSFSDDPERNETGAGAGNNDVIDFLDFEGGEGGYQDDINDEDEDRVFRYGDGSADESIGMDRRPSR